MRTLLRAGLLGPALFLLHPAFAQLTYSTYLPGDVGDSIAVDSGGNAYIGLYGSIVKLDPSGANLLATYSLPNIYVYALTLDPSGNLIAGGESSLGPAYLTKLSPSGQSVFSTSPAGLNSISALALDSAGDIYVTGPSLAKTGFSNTTVEKFSPTGTLVYSYAFGGSGHDNPYAVAVDSAGEAWVAGGTTSTDFPVTPNAVQPKFAGGASAPGYGTFGDAFLAKLDSAGSKLLYATYWGGASSDVAAGIAIDSTGAVYVTGATSSSDFPVTSGAFQTKYGGPAADPTAPNPAGDAFVTKFSPSGAPVWSTYWGGASSDGAYALALDSSDNIYIAGTTESFADFPRAGASIPTCRQTGGPFAAVLDPSGSKLLHSTGLPGISYDEGDVLALGPSGAVYIAGAAASHAFFTTPAAEQTVFPANNQVPNSYVAFAARIDFAQSAGTFAACLLNAASFAAGNTTFFPDGAVAPGEIVSIFGTGLAGASVTFNGFRAPVLYVSANQINAIVPYELFAQTAQVNIGAYGPMTLPVKAAVPGIFTANQVGNGQAAVVNQDGTLNSITNPAARGSVISVYLTGVGQLSPPQADGVLSPLTLPLPAPVLPVTVSIRGVNADIQYAGAAPGYVSGLIQINAVIPTTINFGNLVPLQVTIAGNNSQPDITIAVK